MTMEFYPADTKWRKQKSKYFVSCFIFDTSRNPGTDTMEGRKSMELLRFEGVGFTYPEAEQKALDELTFSMGEGEFLVVCGASGCGKTTLLRMAKPQMQPAGKFAGNIYYKNKPLQEFDEQISAFRIGYVQQNPDNQIVTDTVWHELAFGLENAALPVQTIRRRVE